MKTALVTLLFLTLALNSFASEIVALKSSNPSLSGDLAGIKECQIAETSDDEVAFTSFFYKQDPVTKKTEVFAVTKTESQRIKAFIQPAFTKPKISVINPPDKDLSKLKFDGELNKDKSKVLDLSLKLCISKTNENQLMDMNLFLKQELVKAAYIIESMPSLVTQGYQLGYVQGLSENTVKSFVLGRQIGQIEGLIVGYKKGVADALDVNENNSTATMVNAVGRWNTRSNSSYTYSDFNPRGTGLTSNEGALTRSNKDAVLGAAGSVSQSAQDVDRTK